MILEWLFATVLVIGIIDLIVFGVMGFKIFQHLIPILEQERQKPFLTKERDREWLALIEEWLNDAYHAHPDSKSGLKQVRKELRKQKEGNLR